MYILLLNKNLFELLRETPLVCKRIAFKVCVNLVMVFEKQRSRFI